MKVQVENQEKPDSYLTTKCVDGRVVEKGVKFDKNKPQLALIDPKFIKELGKLMTFGAKKYAPNSWKLVSNGKNRYTNALLRHLYAYLDGELVDEESGASHLTCVAFNAMALSWFEREQY